MKRHYLTIRLATLLAAMLLAASPQARAESNSLLIHFADGTSASIQLYTRPRVTFEGDRVCVRSSVADFSYPAAEVLRFQYRVNDHTVGADAPEAAGETFRQEDGNITFDASVPAAAIQLFAEDGKLMPVSLATANGRSVLSLSPLPAGVYVLKVNGQTSKIVKR